MTNRSPDDALTRAVIGAAIEVHRTLGPGLLESTYESCLAHELMLRTIDFQRQVALPVVYKAIRIERAYRMDLVIEKRLIVELKSVEKTTALHEAQILTYLTLSGFKIGLLINFNARRLIDGLKRYRR